jgi:hypothetical protein
MANKFAWASIGENGKATGGKPGDQTGREVVIGNYYHFGQDMVIRFKSVAKGRKAAKIAKKLAKCESIGYNQDRRYELPDLAAKNNWDYKKLLKALKKKKVCCDCSSFASTVINLAYGKKLIPISTTATIWNNCRPTGKFEKISVKSAEKKFHKGDMPNKAYNHIIINV